MSAIGSKSADITTLNEPLTHAAACKSSRSTVFVGANFMVRSASASRKSLFCPFESGAGASPA